MSNELAGNIENFFCLIERVASLIIQLIDRYTIRVIQVYTPSSIYNDKEVERFYNGIKAAMKLYKILYSFIISDFDAKVRKKM